MGGFSRAKNRIGNFFTTRAKNIELICTKQYDQLFPGAGSHGQQMGEGLYETEVQQMVRNTLRNELESGKKLENITIKFLLSTMKPLHAGWLIDCYDQLISSHRKEIILGGWNICRNICCCRR